MKPHYKLIVALIVIASMSACEKFFVGPELKIGDKANAIGLTKTYGPEIVLKWSEAMGEAIDNKMPQSAQAKIYAMVTLAMHDALNNILPKYETYALNYTDDNSMVRNKLNIDQMANAAVSQSAHDVLIALFPVSKIDADNLLNICLDEIEDTGFKTMGIEIGMNAAMAVISKRQNDPPLMFTAYFIGTEPGIYQANYMPYAIANPPVWPDNAVYGSNLGSFVPFGIISVDQFRPIPPYTINSPEYTADYDEVKRLGCTTCPDRTPEQTETGAFWKENPSGSMNRVARDLVKQEKLDGWETARLFALINMAQIDANIASFETKFYYNFWLPITAIRAGDSDGNDDTQGDVNWTPVFTPPPTPDFVSTPAAAVGATVEVFNQFFKTDYKSFKVTNPFDTPGVVRSYTNFSQASAENALSRIYIGSHFRNSVIEGEKQGRKVGKYIFENNLREIKHII